MFSPNMQTVYCNNEETSECPKLMLKAYTNLNLSDERVIIPEEKTAVDLFFVYMMTSNLPVELKAGTEVGSHPGRKEVLQLLDIAQFIGLRERTVPGKLHLIDLVYEKMGENLDIFFFLWNSKKRQKRDKLYVW